MLRFGDPGSSAEQGMAVQRRVGQWACTAALIVAAALTLAACATAPTPYSRVSTGAGGDGRTAAASRPRAYNRPYEVHGRWYTPKDQPGYDEVGFASWYSYESPSHTTADGEPFDIRVASAAHTTLPIPSWLEVTNLENGRSARVRLNDRGPFVSGRILDLSRGAAEDLGFVGKGVVRVRVRYLGPAQPYGAGPMVWAQARPPERRRTIREAKAAIEPSAIGQAPRLESVQAEVAEDIARAAEPLTPSSSGDDVAAPPPGGTAGGFFVQAGAFTDRRNAERAAERLAEAGAASVQTSSRGDGRMLYRVVVGGWTEAAQAASARTRIANLGFADARVVAP